MNQPENNHGKVEPVYIFRPRLIGSEVELRLTAHELVWRLGGREVLIPYSAIIRVRLGLRLAGLASHNFVTELWPARGSRLSIPSTTMRSIFDVQDNGPLYRTFIEELHRRIAAAASNCRFEAGFAAWRWWPALFVGIATLLGCVYVAAIAFLGGHIGIGFAIVAFTALFFWQSGSMIMRNRPRRYQPHAIPEDVLPKA